MFFITNYFIGHRIPKDKLKKVINIKLTMNTDINHIFSYVS